MMCGSRIRTPRDVFIHLAFGISIGYLLGILFQFDGENDIVKHIHLVEHGENKTVEKEPDFSVRCVIAFHKYTFKPEKILSALHDGYTKLCNETIYFVSNETVFKKFEKNYTMVLMESSDSHFYWHFYQYLLEFSAGVPAQWTFVGDDQTYLIVPNLRRAVRNFDSEKPVVLGKVKDTSNLLSWIFPYSGNQKVAIRGGAVFSNSAIDRLSQCKGFFFARSTEFALYECAEQFGVRIVDPFDEDALRLFNDVPPKQIIAPDSKLFKTDPSKGGKCSDHAVTFGQISEKDMRVLEYGMTMKVFGRGGLETNP
uniref:Uncharacterized protein n=1 Tax=Caenorhabditis japonica TaxID=281687 RepID=A0A8R1ED97_CAEJA